MPRFRTPIIALAALLPLAACNAHKSGASSADSHAPGTTTASVAAECGKYPPGAPGVIRTFCDGPAVVKLTVGGVAHTLTGGACSTAGGLFALNLGVVAGPDLAGPKPDYFGLSVPAPSGHFVNAGLSVSVDGKAYAVTENSGDVTPTGGTFTGKAAGGGPEISGSFTC
jgi:hypothetical protein